MTTQIKVDFSYLIGEFRSLTEQSFLRQVHIKKVIASIKEEEVIMIIIIITMMMVIIIIIIIIIKTNYKIRPIYN